MSKCSILPKVSSYICWISLKTVQIEQFTPSYICIYVMNPTHQLCTGYVFGTYSVHIQHISGVYSAHIQHLSLNIMLNSHAIFYFVAGGGPGSIKQPDLLPPDVIDHLATHSIIGSTNFKKVDENELWQGIRQLDAKYCNNHDRVSQTPSPSESLCV